MKETDRYMKGLQTDIPYNELNEIHISLKAINTELERRRKSGEMKDC
jgi:hypothetical protein